MILKKEFLLAASLMLGLLVCLQPMLAAPVAESHKDLAKQSAIGKSAGDTRGSAAQGKSAGSVAAGQDAAKKPDSYWKKKLDPNTYNVTRCSATEAPFTGKYWNNHADGQYRCSNCGELLFDSKDKFDSGTGWPSFTKPEGNAVESKVDKSLGMERTEVICKHCGAHLGHVFDDGPTPTRKRYCINSASLDFDKKGKGSGGGK